LQRDRVLGTDRRIVSHLREEGSLVSKYGPLKKQPGTIFRTDDPG
jgi:hypothetical protein